MLVIKTILVALNAKFSHSSLALRYLQKSIKSDNVIIKEFTINDNIHGIYSSLLEEDALVYCFSCYIWNIEQTLKVIQLLKIARPESTIVLGGPEATYNSKSLLKTNKFINHIIIGEGEESLKKLLYNIENNIDTPSIVGEFEKNIDLCNVPMPYTDDDFILLKNKIIYFETSRGCPFNCSYCLSSAENGIRYFPMQYVKKGFDIFFKNNVPLVKLIDRTFNSDTKRAIEIIKYIMQNSNNTCVHFEIAPQLLNDEIISLLNSAPKGMFQLEMGIQSINPLTLKSINRPCDLNLITENITKIQNNNIHIHLDLIAGLPFEDYNSFSKSFDYVYKLKPNMLQLGFLKVLHGTQIENDNVYYADFPPYEVISTKWISAKELCELKVIEEAVEHFYNSGVFSRVITIITKDQPFQSFKKLGQILKNAQKNGPLPRVSLYNLLFENYGIEILEPLVLDFLQNNKNKAIPYFIKRTEPYKFKEKCYSLLNDSDFINKYNITPNLKDIRFEPVINKVFLSDYITNSIYEISNYF